MHYDAYLTAHRANLPHTKTIFHLLTILCRFLLAPDAVFTGNNAVPTTTPSPTISAPPTPGKRSVMVCTDVGMLVILTDASPEYETCVHYDVELTLHYANLPHTKTILHLLTILCRFMLALDAVFTGNNAVLKTTPSPTISAPPTPGKRSVMAWRQRFTATFTFFSAYPCMYRCWGVGYSGECKTRV